MSDYRSNFICPACEQPLYVSADEHEVCLTQTCPKYDPKDGFPVDWSEVDIGSLNREMESQQSSIEGKVRAWDMPTLAVQLFNLRRKLVESFMSSGEWPIEDVDRFHALNMLLILNRKMASRTGLARGSIELGLLVDQSVDYTSSMTLIEDLTNRRYPVARTPEGLKPYALKFGKVIIESLVPLGMIGSEEQKEQFFTGWQNDMRSYIQVLQSLEQINDWSVRLEDLVELSLMLDRGFKFQYWTSKLYDYEVRSIDMSVIFGWFLGTTPDAPYRPINYETSKQKWLTHFLTWDKAGRFDEFIGQYIESEKLAPVAIQEGGILHVDRVTALFFSVLLFGRAISNNTTLGDSRSANQRRMDEQGPKFEMVLRNRLRPFFDWVSPDSVKPTKRSKEYDAIAVSESKKVIVFFEAKYRDPAPSSYSGFTLAKQEFSSSGGILAHAKGQRDRIEYFNANIDQHAPHISTKEDLKNYRPVGIVVTRSTPLIHRYQSIEVLSFESLIERLSGGMLI